MFTFNFLFSQIRKAFYNSKKSIWFLPLRNTQHTIFKFTLQKLFLMLVSLEKAQHQQQQKKRTKLEEATTTITWRRSRKIYRWMIHQDIDWRQIICDTAFLERKTIWNIFRGGGGERGIYRRVPAPSKLATLFYVGEMVRGHLCVTLQPCVGESRDCINAPQFRGA